MRATGFQVSAEKPKELPQSFVNENMKLHKRWVANRFRCVLLCAVLGLLAVWMICLPLSNSDKPVVWQVNPSHIQHVHKHALGVLKAHCHPRRTRESLSTLLSPSGQSQTQPFLWKGDPLPDDLFLYPPPFGFRGHKGKVEELLKLMPDAESIPELGNMMDKCRRCVVVGNGGILRGLKLGPLIDRFDVVIRLNSGPLGDYSADVGNRTTIRMSYPEGTPISWEDSDPHTVFVAVIYKDIDITWTSAMIQRLSVPLWDWFFFWKKVPAEIPLEPDRFRLLNPQVIKKMALDILKYPPPRTQFWGKPQNVPTIGVTALGLASLLCDEVSLAGFGYNLSQKGATLHYYDHLPMSTMLWEKSHDVDRETELLQSLVRKGVIADLTGGIHCAFCPS